MRGATTSNVTDILKGRYGDYVRSFNDDCWTLDNAVVDDDAEFISQRVTLPATRVAGSPAPRSISSSVKTLTWSALIMRVYARGSLRPTTGGTTSSSRRQGPGRGRVGHG